MQVSAEIRWFWRDAAPAGLESWFADAAVHGYPAGGGDPRTDEYLHDPGQTELGLKRRGNKPGVEVKGLVSVLQRGLTVAPFAGPVEIWTKWTSPSLELASTVSTEKHRRLRKFDTSGAIAVEVELGPDEKPVPSHRALPALGCNVELTRVRVDGAAWWTLGFESFGTLGTVENSLRMAAAVLAARRPPRFPDGLRASYPAWLAQLPS